MNAAPLPPTPTPNASDDAEDDAPFELPPLDGEADDVEAPELDEDDAIDVDEEAKDLLDDTTGEGDAVPELEADGGAESAALDGTDDADDLDVGGDEIDEFERENLLDDADEPGVGDEDFGLEAGGLGGPTGDQGEEGPEGADEELREEDLPRLDADDDGELEDEMFADAWPTEGDGRPPWDDRAWERVSGVPPVGMARSVVPMDGPRSAVVGGARLMRVGAEVAEAFGSKATHGAAIAAIARLSDGVVAATVGGGVFVSDGAELRACEGWDEQEGPVVELAAAGARIWARTAGGAILASADRGGTWSRVMGEGALALTATLAGELVAIRGGAIVRGEALAQWGSPLPPLQDGPARVCARGSVVVVASPFAGALRSDGGAWTRLEGTAGVTAVTLLDDDGTTLLALHAPAEDRSWIARGGVDGVARIVVELGGEGDDPRVFDLAWSDAHRVAWACGPFGVAIFRPR